MNSRLTQHPLFDVFTVAPLSILNYPLVIKRIDDEWGPM